MLHFQCASIIVGLFVLAPSSRTCRMHSLVMNSIQTTVIHRLTSNCRISSAFHRYEFSCVQSWSFPFFLFVASCIVFHRHEFSQFSEPSFCRSVISVCSFTIMNARVLCQNRFFADAHSVVRTSNGVFCRMNSVMASPISDIFEVVAAQNAVGPSFMRMGPKVHFHFQVGYKFLPL